MAVVPARHGIPEQRRAYALPAMSGKAYKAITRRVADWTAREYVTEKQRHELAELVLRGGR